MSFSKGQLQKTSKFLSYILRHKPGDIDLDLDDNGWAFIDEFIDKSKSQIELTHELIKEVVTTSDKQRFKISDDGQQIRANQGHSIEIDLKLTPKKPPTELYHGTAIRFLDSIKQEGLKPRQRQHVHLSENAETAITVGRRYGTPVILHVKSGKMNNDGYQFFLSENGVWLTSHVPEQYLNDVN